MSVVSTCRVEPNGRVMIPSHFRKALNINSGGTVSIEMRDDGSLLVRATNERCSLCGKSVEDKHHTDVNINKSQKHICFDCAQAIARAMMR